MSQLANRQIDKLTNWQINKSPNWQIAKSANYFFVFKKKFVPLPKF